MRQLFEYHSFSPASLVTIDAIETIVDEYQQDHMRLTVRQLFYQLVTHNAIANTQRDYKRIVSLTANARLSGILDWDAIEDRGRSVVSTWGYDDVPDAIRSIAYGYRRDRWRTQPVHVLVMCEKQALEAVLDRASGELGGVAYCVNKGYPSHSLLYRIGRRARFRWEHNRQRTVVVYLGDHDPSGLDMDRDIEERLLMYSDDIGRIVQFNRLALTRSQVDESSIPPNPAKLTDTRAREYIREHGTSSWELDAIEPQELVRMICDAVKRERDERLWREALDRERDERDLLEQLAEHWPEISELLGG